LSQESRSVRGIRGDAGLRARFWVEAGLAGLAGALFALTLVSRDWIEAVLGVDLDHRSGGLEWLIVAALLAISLVLGAVAHSERTRSLEPRRT